MVFDDIKKSFQSRRRDFSFDSSLLDQLDEQERKIVERMIIEYCLDGDTSCFKHIEHLKYYNPEEIFTLEGMKSLNNSAKVRIIKILFNLTKKTKYIDLLLQLSYQDVGAYSLLTLMYCDGDIPSDYYDRIMSVCDSVTDNQEVYKEFSERMKNVPKGEEESKKDLYDMVQEQQKPVVNEDYYK